MEFIKQTTLWFATGAEAVGAAVIAVAVIEGALRVARIFVARSPRGGPGDDEQVAKEDVRLHLGRWLAVALEFELGADILRTAVSLLRSAAPLRRAALETRRSRRFIGRLPSCSRPSP